MGDLEPVVFAGLSTTVINRGTGLDLDASEEPVVFGDAIVSAVIAEWKINDNPSLEGVGAEAEFA